MADDENNHPVIDEPPPSNFKRLLDAGRAVVAWARRGVAARPVRKAAETNAPPSEEALTEAAAWATILGPDQPRPRYFNQNMR